MPRSLSDSVESHQGTKQKRITACLHCRRQKTKCDGHVQTPCTKCVEDNVECVIRPRANATIVADDLRWQQSVERRLSSLNKELAEVREANETLRTRLQGGPMETTSTAVWAQPVIPQTIIAQRDLPIHLQQLRDTLKPAFDELQKPAALDVSIDDATLLWEYFYDSLAIYHGFTASAELTTPSPLLFSAIVTAASTRFERPMETRSGVWEEMFQRALVRLLYETRPKTWDDVVGLGIARTWFWKADEITSGLIYGSFVETTVPSEADVRSRRVWDFLQMTSVSHGILHLSTPTVPEQPPPGVPARTPSHLLINALNELFDILGMVSRALCSARSLVMSALKDDVPQSSVNYAERVVLQSCRIDLQNWGAKWSLQVQNCDRTRLPAGRARGFVSDLVVLYQQVSMVVIDGYLAQAVFSHRPIHEASSKELLANAATRWAEAVHLWPKLFLHSTLIAALVVPPSDPLVRQVHDLIAPLAPVLRTTGRQLLQRLVDRLQPVLSNPLAPVVSPSTNFDLSMAAAYTGSDSFWDDLTGVLGLAGTAGTMVPNSDTQQWPSDPSLW